jgi:DNA glycosylase AlkZ-like
MARADDALTRLRAWWFRRQGLAGRSTAKTVADGLHQTGWLTTAGSTAVYLSMRARLPGITREAVDRAALDGVDVIEVPGAHARPPALVPRDEQALALRLHWTSYAKHAAPLFASGRYNELAFEAVKAQACRVLDEGALSAVDIRRSVTHPDAGELLTGALIDLAVRGIIRRYPESGRLASPKYLYELRHPDDRPDLEKAGDAATIERKVTSLFLRRHGPATIDEIADWASLTKGTVRKALGALRAERIAVAGWTSEAWLLPELVRAWRTFAGDEDRVVLLPYRDPFIAVRRPAAVLTSYDRAQVLNERLRAVEIRKVNRLIHHAVVAGGELVGVWEYQPETESVVTRLWRDDTRLRARVAPAALATGRFIRDQLGDATLSAVDPPKRRARRLAFAGARRA